MIPVPQINDLQQFTRRILERLRPIGLAELVRKREVSARELIDAAIARAEAANPAINALVLKDYDAARRRASRERADGGSPDQLGAGVINKKENFRPGRRRAR